MRKLKHPFALLPSLTYPVVFVSNYFFESEGWNTHQDKDFVALSKNVLAQYEKNKEHFVHDLDTVVALKSLDDLRNLSKRVCVQGLKMRWEFIH